MTAGPERQIDDRLADWVDGTLSDRERERFVAELRVNPQLRKDLAEYEKTVATVRTALQAPTSPVSLADRVFAAIAAEQQPRPKPIPKWRTGPLARRPLFLSLASAAALLCLALLVNSWSRTPDVQLDAKNGPAEDAVGLDGKGGSLGTLLGERNVRSQDKQQGMEQDAENAGADLPGAGTKVPDGVLAPDAAKVEEEAVEVLKADEAEPATGRVGLLTGPPTAGTSRPGEEQPPRSAGPGTNGPPPGAPAPTPAPAAPPGQEPSRGPGTISAAPEAAPFDLEKKAATKPESGIVQRGIESAKAAEEGKDLTAGDDVAYGARKPGGEPGDKARGGSRDRVAPVKKEVLPLVVLQGDPIDLGQDGARLEATRKVGVAIAQQSSTDESAAVATRERLLAQWDGFFASQMVHTTTLTAGFPSLPDLPSTMRLRPLDEAVLPPSGVAAGAPKTKSGTTGGLAPVERNWLVEGSNEDVALLLGRLATFARSGNLLLSSDEAQVVTDVPPVPPEPKEQADAAGGKPVERSEPTAPVGKSSPKPERRIVLRFRVLRR